MDETNETYTRFSLLQRIEHLLMLTSFTTLGFTGLPQKFPMSSISVAIVSLFGSVETLRNVHHVAAFIMMVGSAYHLLMAGYSIFVRHDKIAMLPSLQDANDGLQALF